MNILTALHNTNKPTIRHFKKWTGTKYRSLAEPREPLKSALKHDNIRILNVYEKLLQANSMENIPQAYRKNHSVKHNALCHAENKIWYRFDFKGFYDTIRFQDFAHYLIDIYPDILTKPTEYKECFIDPLTNGLTQGSPTSGTLAGMALIPFWKELKLLLPPNAIITQYSDDLCISGVDNLTQNDVTDCVKRAIKRSGLKVKLNKKKTREDSNQYRRLTGVICNHNDQITAYRHDYRTYRALLHAMTKTSPLQVLSEVKIEPTQFMGKLSYMLYIDQTEKIQTLMSKYDDQIKIIQASIMMQQGGTHNEIST